MSRCPPERPVRTAHPRGCGEQRPANNPLQRGQDRPVLGLSRHEWKRNYKVQVLHAAPKNMSQSIMVPDSSPECLICSRPAFEGCTAAAPCTSSSPYMASISGPPMPSSNPAFRITFFTDENKEFDMRMNHAPYTTGALKHISPKTPRGWTAIIGVGYFRCPVRL